MKTRIIVYLAAAAMLAFAVPQQLSAQEECSTCSSCSTGSIPPGISENPDGTLPHTCPPVLKYPGPVRMGYWGIRDRYSPARFYAYNRKGIDATRTHNWNYEQGQMRPWHGQYYGWQYGRPAALIVPPTAAFQTQYNWGVAQTKSLPIYHQFNRNFSGDYGGADGMYQGTPYWPSSTEQFGYYPVRGPW